MKVLALFHDIPRPAFDELKCLEDNDQTPRATIFATEFNADVLDRRMLQRAPLWRRVVYRLLPMHTAQVAEAFLICRRYDLVLSWDEKIAFPFALLCKMFLRRVPHVALCSWPGKGMKRILLNIVHSRIDRIVLWSSVQRDILLNTTRVPPSKIVFTSYYVDDMFFRPLPRDTDIICSVGSEMRDFPTLLAAMEGLEIRCHVAAGALNQRPTSWTNKVNQAKVLPSNVSVGSKTAVELRELYARSRFVVVPLLPSDTDNGITCILEAMAMGKPVICSRIAGQVDIIREGETGIFVPPGDPDALREAIHDLWNDPVLAEHMGQAARRYVEEHQRLDDFVRTIKRIAVDVLQDDGRGKFQAAGTMESIRFTGTSPS